MGNEGAFREKIRPEKGVYLQKLILVEAGRHCLEDLIKCSCRPIHTLAIFYERPLRFQISVHLLIASLYLLKAEHNKTSTTEDLAILCLMRIFIFTSLRADSEIYAQSLSTESSSDVP